jgi:putative ABC transport system permease protein
LGMLVARFGLRALVSLSPPGLPRSEAIHLNPTVFAFGVAITTLIGLMIGLLPALQASRSDPRSGLEQNSRQTTGGHHLTRRVLMVAEVAFALVLLASAGLLLRSLQRLFAIDPGFNASHLLTLQLQTVGHKFDQDATERFFSQALEAVRSVPGVSSAALTSQLPLSGDDDEYGARFEGDDPNLGYNIFRYAVSPGYFETTGIALRRGRWLGNSDKAGAPLALVISEALAHKRFGDEDPIGHRVHIGPASGPWFTIVGVVADVKQTSLGVNQPDAVYLTTTQSWFAENTLSLVIRARGDAAELTPAVKSAIWSVDKEQPIARVATMDTLLAASEAQRRFVLILFSVFALVSLILVATGMYGLLSGSVTERIREIGLRSALGASKADILILILRQGLMLATIGILIGLFGAVAASREIASLLFGISSLDPATYAGVVVLLCSVAAVSCWLPAWRAAQVDPAITLRSD